MIIAAMSGFEATIAATTTVRCSVQFANVANFRFLVKLVFLRTRNSPFSTQNAIDSSGDCNPPTNIMDLRCELGALRGRDLESSFSGGGSGRVQVVCVLIT